MMKVQILKTGEIEEYENAYAVRLIEQGRAIPAPAKTEAAKDTKEKAQKTAGGK